ncbi:MAG: hypothetical protein ABIA97_03935 [Candidatus Omnitrophota bacterium]
MNRDALLEKEFKKVVSPISEEFKPGEPITLEEVANVLDLTIKRDNTNKLVVFLSFLSAYTDNNQFNISLNAPSSTGKSYIPLEISELFPKEDVIKIGYCSPTAFFHDWGRYDKENKRFYVDLERKILIFLDQPQTLLLERLRPLLSHDSKEIEVKITDKGKTRGLKTKNIIIRGYASVVFCSASLGIDEQEATRFILLSPETSQDKIKLGIEEAIKKSTDRKAYYEELNSNPKRKALMERIRAIKQARIIDVNIHNELKVKEVFLSRQSLKPRHQRDIGRVLSLIKANALLNIWHRKTEREGYLLTADEDIEAGFGLWDKISYSQELNLSPYLYAFWEEIIVLLYNETNTPLKRKDIIAGHLRIYGRPLETHRLNRDILPMLENASLISQETDPDDRKSKLITPIFTQNQAQAPKSAILDL